MEINFDKLDIQENGTKYNNIEHVYVIDLPFNDAIPTSLDNYFKNEQIDYFRDYPVVYIVKEKENKKKMSNIYIGESANVKQRMKQHLQIRKSDNFSDTLIFGCEAFNKSAIYNIESNLIKYIGADQKYKITNQSQTKQEGMHNYYQKNLYNDIIFNLIWEELKNRKIAQSSVEEIKNKDIFKLSPYTVLSPTQLELKNDIIQFCSTNINEKGVFVVNGEAGSGKSVLLSSLFLSLEELSKDKNSLLNKSNNFFLVNHNEVLKTYESIASNIPKLKKNKFLKPTSFINKYKNKQDKVDVVVVDEAHLLLTKQDNFNYFAEENHLTEIMKIAKKVIVIFDERQVLKGKSYWDNKKLENIIKEYDKKPNIKKLTEQFRMQVNEDTLDWIETLLDGKISKFPTIRNNDDYDLRIFPNLKSMHDEIKQRNSDRGLARVVSTFDFEHKKDDKKYYVFDHEGTKIVWNTTNSNDTWAERKETINEAGSIYTIQGFDLNYVGVVIGPSIKFDSESQRIVVDVDKYKDVEAFRGLGTVKNCNEIKTKIIINSLNILLKRGVHGLYIYAYDDALRKKLLDIQCEDDKYYGLMENYND
ncbi:MAG: DNA/RNA helicase domain-containing protein [Erysipelotrichales bacterium]